MDDFYKNLEEEAKLKRNRKKLISEAQDKFNKRRLNARRKIEDMQMCREMGVEFEQKNK